MSVGNQKPKPEPDSGQSTGGALSPVEAGVVAVFAELAQAAGLPKSYGIIYGLLFISPRPLSLLGLVERLRISVGSASMGLKFLRSVGAVKEVDYNGERSVHYVAVAELRKLAGRFLKNGILPRLAANEQKLSALQRSVARLPAEEGREYQARLALLKSWNANGRRVLPVLMKLLG